MPLIWLRVAVGFYAVGLLYVLALLNRRSDYLSRGFILPCVGLGMLFHFVSLVEWIVLGHVTFSSIHFAESVLAFFLMFLFMAVRVRYKTTSHGIFVFPAVFLLTFASAVGQRPLSFTSPALRSGWIGIHIALIFVGYAALILSFGASLLYLLQTRNLKKSKNPMGAGIFSRMPALEVIDDIGYKSLILGFPFMTVGLVMGAVIAEVKFGSMYFVHPKVMLSLLMWAVYVLLLYTRWNSGWRGRRAAYLATVAFVAAMGAWAASYLGVMHRFGAQ